MRKFIPQILGSCMLLLACATACSTPAVKKISASEPVKIRIASEGKALFPIVVAENAESAVWRSAEDLAKMLSAISSAEFKVEKGNGLCGIAVGTMDDFPEIPLKVSFNKNHPGESQGYEIRTHDGGIYIIGATPQAVSYAVYDLLHRIGYRRFFPSPEWEIIPSEKNIELGLGIREVPSYYSRRIWPGYGLWPEFRNDSEKWDTVNRCGGYQLNTGHAYEAIIKANKKEFETHPEYYGLINGERKSSKLCISNPGLRKLIADYAVSRFENDPSMQSFSVDPSDGGGWCECEECGKIGTPSTRAVLLANTVAEEVRQKFEGKRIGMYAYNQHSQAPEIDVDRDVVASVATAFIKGGSSVDEIIRDWSGRKAVLGIREYYDVCIWSYNLPGRSRGSSLNYLRTTIPEFYLKGARYMTSEASDDWGPSGLGYYIASRILWDVRESENIDALVQDFLQKCFGPAAPDMKEYYMLLDGSSGKHLSSDLLGKMYRHLDKALKKVEDRPDMEKRIRDLVLYTRYCELYFAFSQASGAKRVAAFDQLMEFTASIKNTRMVHSKGFYREHGRIGQIKDSKIPAGDWTNPKTISPEETAKIIAEGISANKLLDFEAVSFSENLVPLPQLSKDTKNAPIQIPARRGKVVYCTWADEKLTPLEFSVTGGLIKHYRNLGNVRCELWKIGGASETGELETLADSNTNTPPDGNTYTVKLTPKEPGLHKLVINDGGDMTKVEWKQGSAMTVHADHMNPPPLSGTFYFYVPKGTEKIGFFSDIARGRIIMPDGTSAFTFTKDVSGYNSIPVKKGTDGKLWKLENISGRIGLMTVPPYLAFEPAGLLLPVETVKKDNL